MAPFLNAHMRGTNLIKFTLFETLFNHVTEEWVSEKQERQIFKSKLKLWNSSSYKSSTSEYFSK